ncbi:MAG: hypothetical protein Q9181_005881 [Wetmoreana brouardii]
MSVTTISVKAISPPPPTPCKERPTNKTLKSLETAATTAPTRKKTSPVMTIGFLPKMWEKLAKLGNATDREVPSSATIIVITARVKNARYSRVEGLHSKSGPSSGTAERLRRNSAWGSNRLACDNLRSLPAA